MTEQVDVQKEGCPSCGNWVTYARCVRPLNCLWCHGSGKSTNPKTAKRGEERG